MSRDFTHTKYSTCKHKKQQGLQPHKRELGQEGMPTTAGLPKPGGNWNLNNSTDVSNNNYSIKSRDARNIGNNRRMSTAV
jgi:hypothetical protein